MDMLTLKIPEIIRQKLAIMSKRKGVSRSDIVREALLEYFEKEDREKQGTFFDLAGDLAGGVTGPADLSTNKEHLSGYGQ